MTAVFGALNISDVSGNGNATLPLSDKIVDRHVFQTVNPANTNNVVATYYGSGLDDVDFILNGAQKAAKEWRSFTTPARVELLKHWLEKIQLNTDLIAEAITREQGKPLAEAKGEIGKALREAQHMLAFALAHGGNVMPGRGAGFKNMVLRRPYGVALAITPWNFPVLTPLRKLVPALATGNAVVLKPSEFTPAAAMLLVGLADDILPENVLTLVNGGSEPSKALVDDPRVSVISFTGSVGVGRQIAATAGQRLTPVSLELGGKNAAIVDDVAELDSALDAIVGAAFQCAGQRCTSISRVIVKRSVLDKVITGLSQRLSAFKIGDGMLDDTTLGPITTADQFDKISNLVEKAIQAGASCVVGDGEKIAVGTSAGRFLQPIVLLAEDPQNPAVQEEIFGPVLTLQPFETDDEAIELLNGGQYGLTSSIFSNRVSFVTKYLDHADTGMLHVNHGTIPDDNMPFVGVKNSGLGTGSVGQSTLDFYTTEHAAYLATLA